MFGGPHDGETVNEVTTCAVAYNDGSLYMQRHEGSYQFDYAGSWNSAAPLEWFQWN